ncbi:MAG: outer membrane beta-barrel protein [Vicinamibacterales bacterium]
MNARQSRRLCAGAFLAISACATPALAQSARLEIGVGGVFNGAASAGTVDARLLDPSGGPLRLFRTTNRIASGVGVEGMVSTRLRDRLRLELALTWGATDFETAISSDFEEVPAQTVTQSVNQFAGELALAWRVIRRGRLDVFLRGGGGAYREITGDRTLVDNGWRASAGGGTQIRLRQAASGWLGRLALRADVRVQARGGGIAFGDSGTRISPAMFAGLVIGQ